ncbi:hypothetical protein [Leifsonia sp. NPDC058248]|uniref:hypothetical protein n=1 Tax=Leifsonia sp. NPDC058248 TaxID=3346402 RepID=UPI0036DED8ED
MPGPAPDPNALRRDRPSDKDGWTTLPSEGRRGAAPAWPLRSWVDLTAHLLNQEDLSASDKKLPIGRDAVRADERESEIWAELWATPQSIVWERKRATHDVALYTRFVWAAEGGDMKAAAEARQWSDRLGLNAKAMLSLRWKIATDEVAAKRAPAAAAKKLSASERLKARNAEVG